MYYFIFSLFIFYCFLGYAERFNHTILSKFSLVLIGVALIFIIGTRYASTDYFAYIDIFNRVEFSNFGFPFYESTGRELQTTGNEFLFATLTSLFKLFDIEPVWWFISIAAISISVKFSFYRKYVDYLWLAVFLYISFALLKEVSQIRNALTIGIILFSMQFAIERKPFKFLVAVLVASGFQAFAMAMLPLYYIGRAGKIRAIYFLLFYFSILSGLLTALGLKLTKYFFFIHPAIASKLSVYLATGGYELGGLYYFLLLGVTLIFIVGLMSKQRDEYYVFASFSFVGFSGYVVFGEAGALGNRFLDVFFYGSIPIIASLMLKGSSKQFKPLIYLYWILFGATIFFAKIGAPPPYQNIIFM